MKVLVACEESQRVCLAFRYRGHEAYSCDLKSCTGGFPEYHIQGDALDQLRYKWYLLIAHPPCTYLAKSGACNNNRDSSRIEKGFEAKDFFMKFYNADIPRICIENPVPQRRFGLPKYSQTVQPYNFAVCEEDFYSKLTLLWLKGLPPLIPTVIGFPDESWCKKHHGATLRSKTFPGIAHAMANQWG